MLLPNTENPLVVRTDFENEDTWKSICSAIRVPVMDGEDSLYAYVEFFEDASLRGVSKAELLERANAYMHAFLFVVDGQTTAHADLPILVVDLQRERGREFRAVPSQIQAIENNLSLANMDFREFADNVDADGIFRGFPAT